MRWEQTFSGTDEEWAAKREAELCLVRPSPRSTAQCEMAKGHDSGHPYEGGSPEAAEFLRSFHAGRTQGGYWKFWAAAQEAAVPSSES
jgi:hypothetical protein